MAEAAPVAEAEAGLGRQACTVPKFRRSSDLESHYFIFLWGKKRKLRLINRIVNFSALDCALKSIIVAEIPDSRCEIADPSRPEAVQGDLITLAAKEVKINHACRRWAHHNAHNVALGEGEGEGEGP